MYNFKNSKSNIINILKSKTPIEDKEKIPANQEFTYANAVRTWVSAIFVDIKSSSELFKNRDEKLARLLRAFTSEIITIFQDSNNYNQIGIRGDCVYAIYSTPQKDDIKDVFDIAVKTNTFMKMFNKLLTEQGYSNIGVGIGLGTDKQLIIKAGRSGTGINDKIWIGDAVVDASNLSSIANRYGYKKIAMNSCFYNNIKKYYEKKPWFNYISNSTYYNDGFYECDIVNTEFDNWIKGGMKDNV
ncbi:MAG: adenylate cyclase [Clostridiales bacterium]|nr:adenylate cyclase [Clostridiales bacterium]